MKPKKVFSNAFGVYVADHCQRLSDENVAKTYFYHTDSSLRRVTPRNKFSFENHDGHYDNDVELGGRRLNTRRRVMTPHNHASR